MIESYPFSVPASSKENLKIALETGALPPWQRYPEQKWSCETAQIPWFQAAVSDWHSQAQDLVGILLDRLKPKECGMMPETALVKALNLMMDDLAGMIAASHYTWMFDPLVLKALEREKQKENRHETLDESQVKGTSEQ